MASPILQATLSHYIAKRDKSIAELDVYLNRPVGVGEHATVVDEVIKLFSELDNADSIIATIRNIIDSQKSQQDEISNLAAKIDAANKKKYNEDTPSEEGAIPVQ